MLTASLRRALSSEPPTGGIAHTPCTPSVNRFGSRHAQAAFAAPKSRMDRPILYGGLGCDTAPADMKDRCTASDGSGSQQTYSIAAAVDF